MSKIDNQYITRAEIAEIAGISNYTLDLRVRHSDWGMPQPVEITNVNKGRTFLYLREEIKAWWLEAKDRKPVYDYTKENIYLKMRDFMERKHHPVVEPQFDNKAAVSFLSRMPLGVVTEFKGIGRATKRETLIERNDHVPPRSELKLYGNRGSYQLHLAGGYL